MKKTALFLFSMGLAAMGMAQQLQFSEPKNLSSLLPDGIEPSQNCVLTKNVTLSLDAGQTRLYKDGNFDVFKIANAKISGKEGYPITYSISQKVILENNIDICDVQLLSGEYVEIKNSIFLKPAAKPAKWQKGSKLEPAKINPNVYATDALFPGKSITYNYGSNGKQTEVNVQFYPLQYNPSSKKAYLITNAEFEIKFRKKEASETKGHSGIKTNAENIIITSNALMTAANSLKTLHEAQESKSTAIVTVSWIDSNYTAAANPTATGIANLHPNPVSSNYNYVLAKKITAYFNDQTAHPNLESITILGDASVVPPSYYFYVPTDDSYQNWICSDYFYASPDYDFIMNYQLGRLPAANLSEAALMVNKLSSWKTHQNETWFDNVTLAGGAPFDTKYLIGELISTDAVNLGYLREKNITKDFLSNGTEGQAHVMPDFADGNTGIIYHIDHGSGTNMYLGNESISYSELMALPAATKYPIVVSIACMNGGYDAEFMPSAGFANCFAEGVLRSQAGGIAYFGGVRSNAGVPEIFHLSNGELALGYEPYMAGMLTSLFKAYSEGNNNFGSISNYAINDYYLSMNPEDNIDSLTFFAYVFLGDPAMSIPVMGTNSYSKSVFTVTPQAMVQGGGEEIPEYYRTSTISIPMQFTASGNSPAINQKLMTVNVNSISGVVTVGSINNSTISGFPYQSNFTPNQSATFIQRYETDDFKETRLYFKVTSVSNIPPLPCNLMEAQNQVNGNYDLQWTSGFDYDGTISSYTLGEYINPLALLDSCKNFDKWNYERFALRTNGGHNNTSCFYSGRGDKYTSSIVSKHLFKPEVGDSLKFWTKYDIETNWDYLYVNILEDGITPVNIAVFTGSQNSWTEKKYDLSLFAGKDILLQFKYVTDENINEVGFYVDDIYPIRWFEQINYYDSIADTNFACNYKPIGDYYYTVKPIDSLGASGQWSNLINVKVTTVGVEGKNAFVNENIKIHPNPFNDKIAIQTIMASVIKIYNQQGVLFEEHILPKGETIVNTRQWTKGLYFIKVNEDKIYKIIKL